MGVRFLRGRVVDTWRPEKGAFGIIVAEGADLNRIIVSSPIQLGCLIEATVEDDNTSNVRIVKRPERELKDGDANRWRAAEGGVSRFERIRQRHDVVAAVRAWLNQADFIEVDTPLVVPSTAPQIDLDPIRVDRGNYLVTSTQQHIRRLIVGGFERIYTLSHNFRDSGMVRDNNPEHTMLEWARPYEPLEQLLRDAEVIIRVAFAAIRPAQKTIECNGRRIALAEGTWQQQTFREAIAAHLGVHAPDDWALAGLYSACHHLGLPDGTIEHPARFMNWLVELLGPKLGWDSPVFVTDWPDLKTRSHATMEIGERVQLFIAGIKLGDGSAFTCGEDAQREQFEQIQLERFASQRDAVTTDERYLLSLGEGLPPGAGMAVEVDRLVMLLTGATCLRDVLTFSWDER